MAARVVLAGQAAGLLMAQVDRPADLLPKVLAPPVDLVLRPKLLLPNKSA
jgi:hypothetical protein